MAQTDPEYRARGPSSLPILIIAWSMPRYRISRYLLSPTWPWTWSRVLARSMGNVPGTETRGLLDRKDRTLGRGLHPSLTAFRRHGSEPAEDKRLPVEAGHVLLQSRTESRRRLTGAGGKAGERWQFAKIKSAASVHFRSGRAAPFLPPCCQKPRPPEAPPTARFERLISRSAPPT